MLLSCHSYVHVYYTDPKDFNTDYQGLLSYRWVLPKLLDKEYQASRLWNDHIREQNADVYVYINDDVVLEINALKRVEEQMNINFPNLDGVVAITQENIPENQACKTAFGAIGTKFADRFPDRKVFCEDYKRLYLDTELCHYVEKHDLLYYSRDNTMAPLLVHRHPAFFKDMMDTTHDDVRRYLKEDRNTYNKRRKKNLLWGDDFENIVAITK